MSNTRWTPLSRRICFLSGALIIFAAVSTASAQSSTPFNQTTPTRTTSETTGESSSSTFQLADDASSDGVGALRSATAALGSSQEGQQGHGFKHVASNGLALEFGGGANAPIGNDIPYITWGGNFTVGGGLHLSKMFSLLAEYQFIDDKLPGGLIALVGTQGGNAHIWSIGLSPVVDLMPKHDTSVYLTGGAGFYRKVTSFTNQVLGEQCYYYCGIVVENETVFHFSSNQGGYNGGLGISHRFGGTYNDSKMKVFAEARYLFIDTPRINSTNGTGSTELIPVTFGVRF